MKDVSLDVAAQHNADLTRRITLHFACVLWHIWNETKIGDVMKQQARSVKYNSVNYDVSELVYTCQHN